MKNINFNNYISKFGGTFTGNITIKNNTPYIIQKLPVDKDGLPDSNFETVICTTDNSDSLLGGMKTQKFKDGRVSQALIVCDPSQNDVYAQLNIMFDDNGNPIAYTPSPPKESNGIEIVNASWVRHLLLERVMPVGSIYVQYSGQSDPTSLFGGTWQNISSSYAGRFFRAEGGSASTFGSNQEGGLPNIKGGFNAIRFNGSDNINESLIDNSIETRISYKNLILPNGETSGTCYYAIDASRSSSLYGAATEVRPINSTIRIWKRTG